MKTATDPRHEKRIQIVHALFAYSFDATQVALIEEIVPHLDEIDDAIRKIAKDHPLETINKLDLAIIRLGVFELTNQHLAPGIVIDEAVEIAKEYGGEKSPMFINAVLGKIVQSL